MKRLSMTAGFLVLSSVLASAGVIEDFEHGDKTKYTQTSGADTLAFSANAAHDGALGVDYTAGPPVIAWHYRTDITTRSGHSYYAYLKSSTRKSGAAYLGVSAGAGGCYSVAALLDDGTVVIQDNTGYGHSTIASGTMAWAADVWYLLELDWKANGTMTGRVWDETGRILLARTPPVSTGQTQPGGLAITGKAGDGRTMFFDTIEAPCLASWSNYGQGLAGTLGVPTLTSSADPIIGTSINIQIGNSLGASTTAAIFSGFVPDQNPGSWGGDLLLVPFSVLLLQLPAGGASLPVSLPDDSSLCDIPFYIQVLEQDAGAIKGISNTQGLKLVFGT